MKRIYLIISIFYILSYSYEIQISQKEYEKRVNTQKTKYKNISILWEEPYNLNGKGIKIAIFDGGKILSSHVELKKQKIFQNKKLKLNNHATTLASIILAKGINKNARGIANKAELYNFSYKKYKYFDAIKKAFSKKIYITNHSYSEINFDKSKIYTNINKKIDSFIYQHPQCIAVFASGKVQQTNEIQNISPYSASKNVLTIGAVDEKFQKPIKISPKGPLKDFRLKPDFVYRGLYILTADATNNKSYHIYRGTSVSTAFVSGIVALISQAYKKRYKNFIHFDLLKAIIIITADNHFFKNINLFTGYGTLNAKKAVDFIYEKDFMEKHLQSTIKNNQIKKYKFTIKKEKTLKTAICWIDPPSSIDAKKSLVNDIDIFLKDKNNTYYPFAIDKKIFKFTKKPNHEDNCEYLKAKLKKGKYTLFIKGTHIKDIQKFSLVSNTPFL
jgi:hypothetical protein